MLRWFLIVGWLFLVCAPEASAADRRVRSLAEFEIAPDGDFVLLPLLINRREYRFLVCTSLATTIIDEKLQEELELPAIESRNGSNGKPRYKLQARLGNSDLAFPDGVLTGDYTAMRQGLDLEFYGEIGMDVLRGQIMQIDFDEGILRFLPAVPPGSGEAIKTIHPGQEYSVPMVQVVVPGQKPQKFFVSTARAGNSLDIDNRFLAALEEDEKVSVLAKEKGVNRSGTRSFQTVRLDEIQIGSFRHEGIIGNSGEGNYVGLSYLSRYLVTFDFPKGKMYLKKGTRYDVPDVRLHLSDVGLDREGNSVMVIGVDPHDRAARVGLRVGDRLEMLNDRRVQRISNWQIRRVLGRSDLAISAEVIRNGAPVKLKSEPVATPEPAASLPSKDE